MTSPRARTTREPRARREPMAMSECPETSGATSGSRAARSVERSTSMYTSTGASEADHTAFSARPRPWPRGGRPHLRQRRLQGVGDGRRRVRAGVVGDGDAEGVGQRLGEVGVQAAHAGLEVLLLVEDRDDDVESGCPGSAVSRPRAGRSSGLGVLSSRGVVMGRGSLRRLARRCAVLCPTYDPVPVITGVVHARSARARADRTQRARGASGGVPTRRGDPRRPGVALSRHA